MKNYILLTTLFVSLSSLAHPIHMDPEMTSTEYRNLFKQNKTNAQFIHSDDPAITEAITLGERLSKWINILNFRRLPSGAIRLTSKSVRKGIPIDEPNIFSPQIIKNVTDEILSRIPKEMKEILLSNGELPGELPISEETFIEFARKIDRNYQSAARYKTINPHRELYIKAASKDVRGYYYLLTQKIGEAQLSNIKNLPAAKVSKILEALHRICVNAKGNAKNCNKDIHQAFTNNGLVKIYKSSIKAAEKNWNSFFNIASYNIRYDVAWTNDTAIIPFVTPEIPKFTHYVKNNIEDEYRFGPWSLKIKFGAFEDAPYLRFQSGVLPHVDRIGGNEIVLDSNQPIEEYESQWIIRHEFGHILGLPDCYHEFFDTKLNAYVNYQIDTSDLMCSRAGNMNERIYLELKKAYSK